MIRTLRRKFTILCMSMVTAVLAMVFFLVYTAIQTNTAALSREVLLPWIRR